MFMLEYGRILWCNQYGVCMRIYYSNNHKSILKYIYLYYIILTKMIASIYP